MGVWAVRVQAFEKTKSFEMNPLTELHRTLQLVAIILDGAAGQIRDTKLRPVRSNILSIGKAFAAVAEIQDAIYRQAPELQLERTYEEPTEEIRSANRRLGEAILAADELADKGSLADARDLLFKYAASECSEHHKTLALRQFARYTDSEEA